MNKKISRFYYMEKYLKYKQRYVNAILRGGSDGAANEPPQTIEQIEQEMANNIEKIKNEETQNIEKIKNEAKEKITQINKNADDAIIAIQKKAIENKTKYFDEMKIYFDLR